ncbi:hypothetical protein [Intestinibacter sp.]|uniref:hypothetical protein n=1 Tax=Intestinibacter sp. TaxID=1965304 RepID=UPI003F166512
MIVDIDLDPDYCRFSESDYSTMYNILENAPEDFLYRASEFMIDRLSDDFEYYYPYIRKLYEYIEDYRKSYII